MKNLYVLPTSKPSRIQLQMNGDLHIENGKTIALKSYQNIYITSDENIKEDDWMLSKLNEVILFGRNYNSELYKKIILTTDQYLIGRGVQAINDEFLGWLFKNQSCEEVEVKDKSCLVRRGGCDCSEMDIDCLLLGYKIIIPTEKPKQETIEEAIDREFPFDTSYREREAMFIGAKWQQQRSYSEENLKQAYSYNNRLNSEQGFKEWFQLFKK